MTRRSLTDRVHLEVFERDDLEWQKLLRDIAAWIEEHHTDDIGSKICVHAITLASFDEEVDGVARFWCEAQVLWQPVDD